MSYILFTKYTLLFNLLIYKSQGQLQTNRTLYITNHSRLQTAISNYYKRSAYGVPWKTKPRPNSPTYPNHDVRWNNNQASETHEASLRTLSLLLTSDIFSIWLTAQTPCRRYRDRRPTIAAQTSSYSRFHGTRTHSLSASEGYRDRLPRYRSGCMHVSANFRFAGRVQANAIRNVSGPILLSLCGPWHTRCSN